jgi:hypothetical protein
VTAAGVHDDAHAFPGFNEAFAGIRAVELQNEIIPVGDLFQQIGGVGVRFFQERAAVHNLAAWQIHHGGKGGDGAGQGGDAGGRHATSGRAGFAKCGPAFIGGRNFSGQCRWRLNGMDKFKFCIVSWFINSDFSELESFASIWMSEDPF